MSIKSINPRGIHDGYKEAVVDSLLNNLSARLAGRGDFYKIIYGIKPSVELMSEFIMPIPVDERLGDEESDPIKISAHGLDFQVDVAALKSKINISLSGSVYVRILPTADEVKRGAILEPRFPLTGEAKSRIRENIKDALKKLATEIDRNHPDWKDRNIQARRLVYEELGIPFDNPVDRSEKDEEAVSLDDDIELTGESEADRVKSGDEVRNAPDDMVLEVAVPQKWLRLDLELPQFEFTPETCQADAATATTALNKVITEKLLEWAKSENADNGGKLWGYRHGLKISPSNLQDWNDFLSKVRESDLKVVIPDFQIKWDITTTQDPIDPSRATVHVALENWTAPPDKNNFRELEASFFQVGIQLEVPNEAHKLLKLDRVKPSYRYNKYLNYPAIGFNAGVVHRSLEGSHVLSTTWCPRYVLPRIVPTKRNTLLNIDELSKDDCLPKLKPVIEAYEQWIKEVEKYPVDSGLEGPNAEEQKYNEENKLQQDLQAWREEIGAIKCGIDILEESRNHWSGVGPQSDPLGIPFEAWVSMNSAMAKVASNKGYNEWRLFQLCFILSSIPAFATRIPEFHKYYTPEIEKHANSVTLLYFATGGGKSEAFLGLLAFVLFLDRLRGKHHGVSALMRYPLRLLTLQQARRTFTTIGAAEEVRHSRGHLGEPFSLGFWVGGSNTPNWHSEESYNDVKTSKEVLPTSEITYKDTQPYKSARERWLKLSACPFCGSKKDKMLALRRHSGNGGNTMGHFCTSSKEDCTWNARFVEPTPLPFYIVDEDIYDYAPSVLLGTVDKLSALGQSQSTIRKFFGMFGFSPLIEKETNRLFIPGKQSDWSGEPGVNMTGLYPTYINGLKWFFDPFPSMLIQDEAHLLDESLGTFAGLFESALEAGFDGLSEMLNKDQLSYEPHSDKRRKIKVIAASATVSDPQLQMRNLYQRECTVQFPHPGPDLYYSFYAEPKQPDDSSEDLERVDIEVDNVELRSHWARVYGSVLTNGHRHTVAMAAVLGQYHLLITHMYERLRSEIPALQNEARKELINFVSTGELQNQFSRLLQNASCETLLTLIDLHRISLTYVTNKKGGDQVIDTEKVKFDKLHKSEGYNQQVLASELISGAVSAAEIQDIVRRAEKRVGEHEEFPDLNETLRSVIATSAISHGVDVEEFNAMFFAGMPSDIAEYIQASSRIGRTHIGFSLFVPIPQRHRDRFVLEIHDIFHRFLERMILPASIDRWAEKALVRVMPSFFQEFVCGINAITQICNAEDSDKPNIKVYSSASDAKLLLDNAVTMKATEEFMEKALGLNFMPSPSGKAYYRSLIKKELDHYLTDMHQPRLVNGTNIGKFFELRNAMNRPMTSLRDVDQPGVIFPARSEDGFRPIKEGALAKVMQFIRRGSGSDIDDTLAKIEAKGN